MKTQHRPYNRIVLFSDLFSDDLDNGKPFDDRIVHSYLDIHGATLLDRGTVTYSSTNPVKNKEGQYASYLLHQPLCAIFLECTPNLRETRAVFATYEPESLDRFIEELEATWRAEKKIPEWSSRVFQSEAPQIPRSSHSALKWKM